MSMLWIRKTYCFLWPKAPLSQQNKITLKLVQYQILKSSRLENWPGFCLCTLIRSPTPCSWKSLLRSDEKVTGHFKNPYLQHWYNISIWLPPSQIWDNVKGAVLLTQYYNDFFWPKFYWKPCNKVGSKSLTKNLVEFERELSNTEFNKLTHQATLSKFNDNIKDLFAFTKHPLDAFILGENEYSHIGVIRRKVRN